MEVISADDAGAAAPLAKWRSDFSRVFQYYLDRSTPHPVQRWLGTVAVFAVYVLRVYFAQGFYIVSYGIGIYVLNLLIGFLSPIVDPELELLDGTSLPTRGSDEFKPFIRRLPEFKFWVTVWVANVTVSVHEFFGVNFPERDTYKFFEERAALEAKYQKLYEPLYTKRYGIVNGVVEVEDVTAETTADDKSSEEKGVPDFWLTAMKTNEMLAEEI